MDEDNLLHQELEALAGNAYNPDTNNQQTLEPISTTIKRWVDLFDFSPDEAIDCIQAYRNNLTRLRISDAHWDIIRAEKEAAGYDREAYEYELELEKRKAALPGLVPAGSGSVKFLVELGGPLDSVHKLQQAAGIGEPPEVVSGTSVEEDRDVVLCCIDDVAKRALLRWAVEEGKGYEPTILADPRRIR